MLGLLDRVVGTSKIGACDLGDPCCHQISKAYKETIPVRARLEMSDRYRFHYLQPLGLKLSDTKAPHAGG
jgi:hypothetical protein